MAFENTGIYRIGQLIQGKSSDYPNNIGFGSDTFDFTGAETDLDSEFLRKPVSWADSGLYSKYTVEVSTLEGNGSDFNVIGLFDDSIIGSGNLWTYDESFIGSKNNSFVVQVEGEVIIRRPV